MTFSTSLIHEYVLLHQTGRAAGYSERSVQQWLDAIRRAGLDARMTQQWRPNSTAKARELEADLERFLQHPSYLGHLAGRSV